MLKKMNRKNQWNAMAKSYLWSEFESDIVLPRFLDIIGNVKGKKVLDLGCGPGNIAYLLAKKGGQVTGVNDSEEMLKVALDKEVKQKQDIHYIKHDFITLNKVLKGKKFDNVVFSFVLHNIYPVNKMFQAIKEARQKLKKNGMLFILDPHPCFEYTHLSKDTTRASETNQIYKDNFPIKITLYPKKGKSIVIHHRHRLLQDRHRLLRDYINAIAGAGLKIQMIKEVTAPKKLNKKFSVQYKTPFYLILKVQAI